MSILHCSLYFDCYFSLCPAHNEHVSVFSIKLFESLFRAKMTTDEASPPSPPPALRPLPRKHHDKGGLIDSNDAMYIPEDAYFTIFSFHWYVIYLVNDR